MLVSRRHKLPEPFITFGEVPQLFFPSRQFVYGRLVYGFVRRGHRRLDGRVHHLVHRHTAFVDRSVQVHGPPERVIVLARFRYIVPRKVLVLFVREMRSIRRGGDRRVRLNRLNRLNRLRRRRLRRERFVDHAPGGRRDGQ
jgi:hypothetical protein